MCLAAVHYGQVQSINNLLQVFLAPITSALSDRFGRMKIMALGTLGPMTWSVFGCCKTCRSP